MKHIKLFEDHSHDTRELGSWKAVPDIDFVSPNVPDLKLLMTQLGIKTPDDAKDGEDWESDIRNTGSFTLYSFMYEKDFNNFLDYVNEDNKDGKYFIEINTGGNRFSYGMIVWNTGEEPKFKHKPRS